jgi:hypothetical protein
MIKRRIEKVVINVNKNSERGFTDNKYSVEFPIIQAYKNIFSDLFNSNILVNLTKNKTKNIKQITLMIMPA